MKIRSLAACGLFLTATSNAYAVLIPFVDFAANGSIELTTTIGNAPFSDGDVTQTGQIRSTLSGASSSNGFSTTPGTNDGVNDATTALPSVNPIAGALTDTGDGVGFSTDVDAGFPAGFNFTGRGYDFITDTRVNLANNSTGGVFTVTMQLDYDQRVDVTGSDAFAELEFNLEVDNVDVFFSELKSDSLLGDELDGVAQGTFGETIANNGTFSFDVVLNPGDAALVQGFYAWDGAVYASGASFADTSIDLSIANVTCTGDCNVAAVVPIPGAVWLFASGLSLLAVARRRQRTTATLPV